MLIPPCPAYPDLLLKKIVSRIISDNLTMAAMQSWPYPGKYDFYQARLAHDQSGYLYEPFFHLGQYAVKNSRIIGCAEFCLARFFHLRAIAEKSNRS